MLGNRAISTPHLDGLVREGTSFLRASCASPICVASRAELLTGCTIFRNGALHGGAIDPQLPRWADTMRRAGYHTWYVGKWWRSEGKPADTGYEESQGLFGAGSARGSGEQTDWAGRPVTGFKNWMFQTDDGRLFPERGVGLTAAISSRLADAAIGFIRRKPERPFFLQVNFTAPHDPLLMPPGYEKRYDPEAIPLPANFLPEHPFDHGNFRGRDELLFPWPRTSKMVREELAVYYAVITHLDAQIGRILKALAASGELENTVVVFTSDNGLAIGSHGLRGKQNMYEHSIGVPLILRGPGIPKGRRSSAQCYLRDLFPTTCDLAGIEPPPAIEGRSLAPILSGRSTSIYNETYGYFRDVQRMIRTNRWKLVWYPKLRRRQLFDLAEDPHELEDLSAHPEHAGVREELTRRLRAWLSDRGDPLAAQPALAQPPPQASSSSSVFAG